MRLFIVGLGDKSEGMRIPVTATKRNRTFLQYNGREGWSRLDADILRQVANSIIRYFLKNPLPLRRKVGKETGKQQDQKTEPCFNG